MWQHIVAVMNEAVLTHAAYLPWQPPLLYTHTTQPLDVVRGVDIFTSKKKRNPSLFRFCISVYPKFNTAELR